MASSLASVNEEAGLQEPPDQQSLHPKLSANQQTNMSYTQADACPPASAMTSRFTDLPPSVQQSILELALLRPDPEILPYYRCGMLKDGSTYTGLVNTYKGLLEPGVVENDDVDLSLLRVNKDFNKRCSAIFYGRHWFVFSKAEVCKWWVKHIGASNFSRVRALNLELGTGFQHKKEEQRSTMELSQEEMWLGVLLWMKNRHRIEYFKVAFNGWQDLTHDNAMTNDEQDKLRECRKRITNLLWRQYRGMREVDVTQYDVRWLSDHEAGQLEMLMQQRKPVTNLQLQPKPNLSKLIHDLRLDRKEREAEQRRQQRREYEAEQRRRQRREYEAKQRRQQRGEYEAAQRRQQRRARMWAGLY